MTDRRSDRPTDGATDQPTDGQTDPLIENERTNAGPRPGTDTSTQHRLLRPHLLTRLDHFIDLLAIEGLELKQSFGQCLVFPVILE